MGIDNQRISETNKTEYKYLRKKKKEVVKHIRKWNQELLEKEVSGKTSLEVYEKLK